MRARRDDDDMSFVGEHGAIRAAQAANRVMRAQREREGPAGAEDITLAGRGSEQRRGNDDHRHHEPQRARLPRDPVDAARQDAGRG